MSGTDWRVWARIGFLSFGGPAGQIALMHHELVERRRWIDEARFLHALNFCMILPGPEAMQLATYVGWMRGGWRGGLVAGGLFVLPGALAVMALAWVYVLAGTLGPLAGVLAGLKAAVIALVAMALVRLTKKALLSRFHRVLALGAFGALFVLGLPFPLVVLGAALLGYALARGKGVERGSQDGPADRGAMLRTGLVWLALWLVPVAGLLALLGPGHVMAEVALLFSQLAVLTFGGAYAVLAWVAQTAVEGYGWLTPAQMIDGLALAETTPGPLILTLQFVGFMAGFNASGGSLAMGTLAGLVALWVTFAPCFLWIFALAPMAERLRRNPALAGALAAVTAAVVGVIASLALWFAVHALFSQTQRVGAIDLPVWSSLDAGMAGLSLLALLAGFGLRLGAGALISGCALAGLALHLVN